MEKIIVNIVTEKMKNLNDWRKEYYPVRVFLLDDNATDKELLEHALLKWTGLKDEVLDEYNLYINEWDNIQDDNGEYFSISADTCSLCKKYIDDDCIGCPLYKNGKGCIDEAYEGDRKRLNPWEIWCVDKNPNPMIEALKECLQIEITKENNLKKLKNSLPKVVKEKL